MTGTIFGLANSGTSAATDIVVTSAPSGVGGTPPIDVFTLGLTLVTDSFTVTNGDITAANFGVTDNNGSDGAHLLLNFSGQINSFNLIVGQFGVLNEDGFAGITFTPVASTPLPAALPLFASGLGGLGLLGWRRKR